jgi:cell division septation protein DedD
VAPAAATPPAVAVVPSTAGEAAAATTLVRKSFYLQLGAYSTLSLAQKLASQVSGYARYTVAILPTTAGPAPMYKVLIGPLNRDESGTLLYQFRARGFRDAFLQYVE